ncbi:MAG TPA: ATP-binding protein [Thermoanaerobaculia bacterium]|nr:ATP-binding protein [Thermoanaerobaculia bacterium]
MPARRRASRSALVTAAIVIGIVSSLVLIGVDALRGSWSAEDIGLTDSVGSISSSLATSHLWMEAALDGDKNASRNAIESLELARRLSEMLSNRGLASGILAPDSPVDPRIEAHFATLHREIEAFADRTRERLRTQQAMAASTSNLPDQERRAYERAFGAIMAQLGATTQALEQRAALVRSRSRLLGHLLQVAWVGLVVLALAALLSREHRKHEAEAALHEREIQILRIQKLEAVGRLAGGIAHDINNYLGAIIAQSELAKRRIQDADGLSGRMNAIQETAEKASILIQRVLAFGRRQPTQPEVVELNRVVEGLDTMIRRWVGDELHLEKHLASDLWRTKVDPAQVEQIIVNLLVNARDATPPGGLVTISTANATLDEAYWKRRPVIVPGDYVQLSVSDTGSGIPEDLQEKIFEPFFSTKNDRERSGLGLATVYGIVKQNSGNVWVYSEPGLGTTVKVYLPRCAENAGSPSREVEGTPISGTLTAKVLLVEDNDAFRVSTREILESLGLLVLEARDASEALTALRVNGATIDLLITDVVMPGPSGFDLARQVRKLRASIPILFMSGFSDHVLSRHGMDGVSTRFLQKPFSADRLVAEIRLALGGKTAIPGSEL